MVRYSDRLVRVRVMQAYGQRQNGEKQRQYIGKIYTDKAVWYRDRLARYLGIFERYMDSKSERMVRYAGKICTETEC